MTLLKNLMLSYARVAQQGSPTMLTAITGVYHPYAKGRGGAVRPFKKYFEELQIGDQLIFEKRKTTTPDIDRLAG